MCSIAYLIIYNLNTYDVFVFYLQGFTYPVRSHFLEEILETTKYKLTQHNQIDDYGFEKKWKMEKQSLSKKKSQLASAVEVT